jgi:hypothetical protein
MATKAMAISIQTQFADTQSITRPLSLLMRVAKDALSAAR